MEREQAAKSGCEPWAGVCGELLCKRENTHSNSSGGTTLESRLGLVVGIQRDETSAEQSTSIGYLAAKSNT